MHDVIVVERGRPGPWRPGSWRCWAEALFSWKRLRPFHEIGMCGRGHPGTGSPSGPSGSGDTARLDPDHADPDHGAGPRGSSPRRGSVSSGWFVIRRGLFDHRLVEAAVEAGARFQSVVAGGSGGACRGEQWAGMARARGRRHRGGPGGDPGHRSARCPGGLRGNPPGGRGNRTSV